MKKYEIEKMAKIINPVMVQAIVPSKVIYALQDKDCHADILGNLTTDKDMQILISAEELCNVVCQQDYFPVHKFPAEFKILKKLYNKYKKADWFWLDCIDEED